MPTAYHPWSSHRIPSGDHFAADTQYYLDLNHQDQPEAAHTDVTKTGTDFRPGVDRFLCTHDYLTRLKYPGRAQGRTFSEYVSPYKFPMYLAREGDQGRPVLWVGTKEAVATDFIKRLNTLPDFHAVERRVDFDRLRPQLTMIKGAWFAEMRAANLSSTAVYGTRVDRSHEFRRAEQQGRLRTLSHQYRYNGVDYLLMVTIDGTIVTYDAYDTEEQELDVVMDFKRRFLDSCWSM